MEFFISQFLPEPLKNLAKRFYGVVPEQYRTDKEYFEMKRLLSQAQLWDRARIEEWQFQRAKEVVKYAYDNIPAYNRLYREARLNPEDIRSRDDLSLLPLVNKEMIRSNINDFTSRSVPARKRIRKRTSGSTGVPFQFYSTALNQVKESAFMHSSWEWVGWRMGDRAAVLRGKFLGSVKKFWHFNPLHREMRLSSYHLTETTYQRYMEKLLQYRPLHLMAYPSAAANLADLVLLNGDAGRIAFKTIFLGSENIYEWQKKRLKDAFPGARVFGWYGHAEEAVYAPMCESSDHYHIWPLYGLAEVLDQTGAQVGVGETGRLIGTSFWNYATPFIRYDTMDYVRRGKQGCDKCGRKFQLLEAVDGRIREILVSKSGRRIPAFSAANLDSELISNIKQFQFFQEKPGAVIFRIIRNPTYTDKDTANIKRVLGKKLGDDMDLEIVFPETIQKTQSGKNICLDHPAATSHNE